MLGKVTAGLILHKTVALIYARSLQFVIVAAIFIPLERLIPYRPKQRLFRSLIGLDLLHYFLGGFFIIIFVRFTYYFMPLVSAWSVNPLSVRVRNFPWWGQVLSWEIGWTFLGYWLHRLEHTWQPLWRMHAIHESSKELDWLSAFRLHPFDPSLFQVFTIIPLWLLGMSYPTALAYSIYSYIFAHVQHSNVVLPIGPLKYILPTPDFHRWHHARMIDQNGQERPAMHNFGQYPIWDLMFGTFYLPEGRPAALGSAYGDQIPNDYLAQLVYPFGWHEKVLAWKRDVVQRFQFRGPLARMRASVAPTLERLDGRLARLCLVTATAEGEKN